MRFQGLGFRVGRTHFHPKTVSSTDTFIQTQFHPMTLSYKTVSAKVKHGVGQSMLVGDAFTQTRLMPTFGVSAGLSAEHCRPQAGNVQQKSQSKGVSLRGQGFEGLRV